MGLRPSSARWFELLVARDDLAAAVDVLAQASLVELEARGEPVAADVDADSRELFDEFEALEHRYGVVWPAPRAIVPAERVEPNVLMAHAVERLRLWSSEAAATVERLRDLWRERDDLVLVETLFRDAGEQLPDIERLAGAGPMLEVRLYLLSGDAWPKELPASVITQRLAAADNRFFLAVGLPQEIATLDRQFEVQKARRISLPPELPPDSKDALQRIRVRLDAVRAEIDAAGREVDALNEHFDVAAAVSDAHFVAWYVETVPQFESTENFAWLSGWTSLADEEALLRLLDNAGIKGLLRLAEPPPGLEPPQLLANPRWMRPFELFTGMLGVPGAGEADPTRVVAIAAPLMFGYMFGDVGHGAVLLVAGLILGRRYPALKLLVAGGAVSIVFGFLYGSVFALETLIAPLWMHPLEHPILMMLVPLAGGAVLLLTGMLLDALQLYWQRRGLSWWQSGAGLLLCYVALLGALAEPRLLIVAAAGAAWFIAGHAIAAGRHRPAAAGEALTEFLESMLQVLVNTLSFVRVGAFALAHAGLSLAVVGVADAPASLTGKVVVLVLGNALIIVLEGLIVGIQTTRLVLFEFFVRFLRAEGRPFRPLVPPRDHRRPT
ncbi:MAG: ATPase [Gammaproteobacteria bacterium]|nr:ATPase [Gammaproteobacteria bacterium]